MISRTNGTRKKVNIRFAQALSAQMISSNCALWKKQFADCTMEESGKQRNADKFVSLTF